ncbi:MAG TPA: urease accessory UreF family protein [Pseudonocardiaceae bacterium]
MVTPSVLLLADSRLPSGGHAHSGGIEMAVAADLVSDVDDLDLFLRGRLRTAGPVLAGFAAAGCLLADQAADWQQWDRAYSARTLSAGVRAASRAQGSALLRTVSRIWDHPALGRLRALGRPHQPLVLGVAVAAGNGAPADAAALAVHHLAGAACSAAIRLLGLDPLAVAAVHGGLSEVAARATEIGLWKAERAVATGDPAELPATGTVLPELLAARHAQSEVTLFAS